MITKTTTIYQCEFCKKVYQRKHYAEQHEDTCVWNPANHRNCYACSHMKYKLTTTVELYDKKVPYCKKYEHYLLPPIVEKKLKRKGQEPYKLNKMNVPMPLKCEGLFITDFNLFEDE